MEMLDAVTAFDGAVSGLSKLTSLVGNLRGDMKGAEIDAAVASIREDLDTAKQRLSALIGENLALKQQVAALTEKQVELNLTIEQLKASDTELQAYELVSVGQHTTLYQPRQGHGPKHYLCVRCHDDRQKSILQLKAHGSVSDVLACPRCAAEYLVPNDRDEGPMLAHVRRSDRYEF